MTQSALRIDSLSIAIGDRQIVQNVSIDVREGEALALVGESGSGKSMTLRAVLDLLPPGASIEGTIEIAGKRIDLMRRRDVRRHLAQNVGMIFQDPRAHINPVRTIGDFLVEGLTLVRGVRRRDAIERARVALADVGIADAAERMAQYPHELSGGLLQRVMIASVLIAEPHIVLADEPTTALDVSTQEEVVAILDERRREHGMAMIFVSHDLDLASAITERTAVMYAGSLVEVASSVTLHNDAAHPYTRALFASRPDPLQRGLPLRPVPGRPIAAFEATTPCPFAPRCPKASDVCRESVPTLAPSVGGLVACFHPEPGA